MGLISDYELLQMRAIQYAAMPERVTIERRTITSDGFGGATTGANATIAVNVPARITQAQQMAMLGQSDRDLLIEKWTIRLPTGIDLKDEDFIVWGKITLQVEDVKDRTWATCLTAMAEVVK